MSIELSSPREMFLRGVGNAKCKLEPPAASAAIVKSHTYICRGFQLILQVGEDAKSGGCASAELSGRVGNILNSAAVALGTDGLPPATTSISC